MGLADLIAQAQRTNSNLSDLALQRAESTHQYGVTSSRIDREAQNNTQGTGELTLEDLINLGLLDDSSGGGGAPAFSSTEAGLRLQAQLDAETSRRQFQESRYIEQFRQQFEERQKAEALKLERQRLFAEMVGNDPVRAVLFGLGLGGQMVPGAEKFAGLPLLGGARPLEMDTERALAALQGKPVDINTSPKTGKTGVHGLTTPEQLARQFMSSGANRTLLTSAFGVGGSGTGFTGLNPDELARRIAAVTPKGVLP